MHKPGRERLDPQPGCRLRRVMAPRLGSRNSDRRDQILMYGRQDGTGADLFARVAADIVTASQSETGNGGEDSRDTQLAKVGRFEEMDHWRTPEVEWDRAQPAENVSIRTTTTIAERARPVGTTAV